ncbi:hypothetical protein GCM10007939_02050 [Amylibacter marinus]|uniref:Poly(3-hydroxyalkanoate) polymerase subunit PhaE n=1 Tax=Amylibacter marinus TaxID=1475483 RepID=A0ABQ5VRN4_9RHOB|nr:poly(R)-hydroxyalkanoic acid synthase subunit PhaE [Amylibacter marinus]GLQ33922.1 hypothetical protein GCM10007939_02050 [Amylibacter marinus]
MADKNDGMDAMMQFWKQGQDSFFDAQREMAENFGRAFAPKPKDPISQGVENWQNFVRAWAPGWDPSAMMASSVQSNFDKQKDAYFALFDPSTWMTQAPEQLRSILESVANMPQLADLTYPQIGAADQWQEMIDFQEASSAFGKVMQEAWSRAYATYSKHFSVDDLKAGNVTEALNAWVKTANEELLDTQSSTEFMAAQRGLIQASSNLTKRQAKMAEAWGEKLQMPTRTEIDDLTETVHKLKRELRKLKKDLRAAQK